MKGQTSGQFKNPKKINEYVVGEIASFKDNSQVTVNEDGDYIWKSQIEFSKKKGIPTESLAFFEPGSSAI